MKKLISLLFVIFLLTPSYSQKELEGKFCANIDAGHLVTCINFKLNNRFEYSIGECLGETRDKGAYKLNKKNLWLYFDKIAPQKKESRLTIEKLDAINKGVDSITLYINAVFKDNREGTPCIFINKKGSESYKAYSYRGNWGNFEVKLPCKKKTNTFEIWNVGYEIMKIEIDQRFSYRINLISAPQPRITFISDTTFHYRLKEVTPNYFIVKNAENFNTEFKKEYLKIKK